MDGFLKQSTAVTLKVGPFVDEDDGKTAETGLTISQADVRLSKNGGNMAQKNDAASATHDENGIYDVDLDTTDTGTLGLLTVLVYESGALPVKQTYMVVPANVYESLVGGSDSLEVDTTLIEGADASNAINAEADQALSDYDPPTKAELDSGLAALNDLSAAEVNAEVDTALADYDPPTKTEMDSGFSGLNDPTAAAIASQVMAEVVETSGSYTVQQVLSIVLAALAGVTADNGATIKDPAGTATRIAASLNASNERTAITLTPSS